MLDSPLILSILFHPRKVAPGGNRNPGVVDGMIVVDEGVELGYRFYIMNPCDAVILYFHGNGEVAPDYDDLAAKYHEQGAALLVVDYRGYGWSTGKPLTSALLPDAEKVAHALPGILGEHGLSGAPVIVMGRSLGSAPAIHVAYTSPDSFTGLILVAGFANIVPLLSRLGLPVERFGDLTDPMRNTQKLAEVDLPLLVVHGERDTLIPFKNGEALYNASPAANKRMLRMPRAGHNDLLFFGMKEYFDEVRAFIQAVTERDESG